MNAGEHPDSPERRILFPALEQSMMAVVLIDDGDRVQFFNEAAEYLWGYPREEVLGNSVNMLVPGELKGNHVSFIRYNRQGGQDRVVGMNRQLQLERRDGSRIWASFALSRAEVEGKIHYLAMARNVTAEVQRQEENRLLLMAMAHTDQPVVVLSSSSQIIQANRAFSTLYGYAESEVIGQHPAALLAAKTERENNALLNELLEGYTRRVDELNTLTRNGLSIWVRISSTPVHNERGELENRVLTFTDITENQKIRGLEKEILSTLLSERTFDDTGAVICRQAEAVLPGARASLYHLRQKRQHLWAKGSPAPAPSGTGLRRRWPVHTGAGRVEGSLVLEYVEQTGSERFTERVADVCTHFCSLAMEKEASRQQIERLKQFDALTGLPGRNRLHQHLDRLLEQQPAGRLAVFCMSIDRFSYLNEMNGYAIADQLLLTMAERLRQILRPDQYISRTEGIQFVLIAPDYDADRAAGLAGELVSLMKMPVTLDEDTFSLTISTGISLYPGGDRDLLLTSARHAMERLRDNGGDGWQFFEPDANRHISEEQRMAVALKKAIADETLTLHYQPQVRAHSGELYGVEALARWTDPVFGRVPPPRFVALADKMGETINLGKWVLQEACRQLAEWRQQGLAIPSVSVNLTPKDFREADLPSRLRALLERYRLPGECLTLEMTENDMIEMSDTVRAHLCKIRALGVGLSVDDFGTGFSGLQNLARLPVTEIKIDKGFIDHMITDKCTRSLTEAMIGIGQNLELNIVAEGVETQAQLDFLRDRQCPIIQGYLFSAPLPAESLIEWVIKNERSI